MGTKEFKGFLRLASGKQLNCVVGGSGPALLLLHGLGSSLNFWGAVVDEADLESSYRIVRYDNEGASGSKLSGQTVSIDSLVADAIAVLDALSIDKAHIVGHSMSGLVASTLAAKHPERIEKLVLMGAITAPASGMADVMRARAEKAQSEGMVNLADAVPTAAFSQYSMKHRRLAYAFVRHLVGMQPPEGYAANCQAIVNAKDPDYRSIQARTLVLAGAEDKTSPAAANERFKSEIPHCELVTLKDVGHWHAVESPKETGEAIKAFLAAS